MGTRVLNSPAHTIQRFLFMSIPANYRLYPATMGALSKLQGVVLCAPIDQPGGHISMVIMCLAHSEYIISAAITGSGLIQYSAHWVYTLTKQNKHWRFGSHDHRSAFYLIKYCYLIVSTCIYLISEIRKVLYFLL